MPKLSTQSFFVGLAVTATLFVAMPSTAAAPQSFDLVIENHEFTPAELHLKSGQPTVLHIENKDDAVEEFDSPDLKIEKIIAGHASAVVHLRPLQPGDYLFIGEFHADTAQGVVISE